MIRIVIADDHPRVRAALRQLLSLHKNIELVCEGENGQEAVKCVKRLKPDVLVMDIHMPVLDGFEATRQIINLKLHTRVILISLDIEDITVSKATELGARGFLPKDLVAAQLFPAIQTVYQGETFFKRKSDVML